MTLADLRDAERALASGGPPAPQQERFIALMRAAQERARAAPFAGPGPDRSRPPLAVIGIRG